MADIKMPDLSAPVIDPKTGRITEAWAQFFVKLLTKLNSL